jgi:dTDP-4-dehydrorhamnose 3,5-epimerase
MQLSATKLAGVFTVDLDLKQDARGFFARLWCPREMSEAGLSPKLAQCSLSYNTLRGTLRGMHYQAAPYQEAKLVRCIRGALWDVALDLRPGSPTFRMWTGVELSRENRRALYIPEGCAHGFVTLEPDTEILYQISEFYDADAARGVRWNDPAFGIDWPEPVRVIAPRDRDYPDFQGTL